jgi:hypothetical protein
MAGRPRIIVATPDPTECEVLAGWLAAEGFEPIKRTTLASAADAVQTENFDLFIADFTFAFRYRLHAVSRRRIRDLKTPTVVIGELDVAGRAHAGDRQAMYLSRPVERAALMCLVSMAILDSRPVRRSPRKIIQALGALVNGAPSQIIDLSPEGIRLEIPRDGRPSPPPTFSVRVPIVGVTLTVQRMWARTRPGSALPGALLCGGSVSMDQPGSEEAWRAFVDAIPTHSGLGSDMVQVVIRPWWSSAQS